MSSRSKRAAVANETLEILKRGTYTCPNGHEVDIAGTLKGSIQRTVHVAPESFEEILRQRDQVIASRSRTFETKFIVKNTTTLTAARELLSESPSPVLCLNFASAKNPGGGFISGSQAQEESLARLNIETAVQRDYLPALLIRLAADAGLGICINSCENFEAEAPREI